MNKVPFLRFLTEKRPENEAGVHLLHHPSQPHYTYYTDWVMALPTLSQATRARDR